MPPTASAKAPLYGMRELIAGIRRVRADTIRIAGDIPSEHYGFRPTAQSRSVGETLVHIACLWSLDRHLHDEAHLDSLDGFDFPGLIARWRAEEARPRSKAEIVDLLRAEGERFVEWLERLPERLPAERVGMPGGGSQTRFALIVGTKEHEIHHRAQLTVLERLIGVVPHFIAASAAA
jgi:uncharacterized damage-inducible protein DinB